MNPEYKQWLIAHGLEEWARGLPQLGSKICQSYLVVPKAGHAKCNPNCPFSLECTPYFESLNQELFNKFGITL